MAEILSSGRAIDWILALMLVEGAVLWVYWSRTGRGVPPASLAATLFAGACLLLALRAALTGADPATTLSLLLLGLFGHLLDVSLRWQVRR